MHVVLVNQFWPPDAAPTGIVLSDVARGLAARGHAVTVLCSRAMYAGAAVEAVAPEGLRVLRLPAPGLVRRLRAGRIVSYGWFHAAAALRLAVLRPRPDLVVALTSPPYIGLTARTVARRRGVPHAHWIMDAYPDVVVAHGLLTERNRLYRLLAWLTRRQLSDARLVLTVSPDMAARLGRYGGAGARALAIPLWSAGPQAPAPADPAAGVTRPLRLLYSGNMGLGHRFTEFLNAARATRDWPVEWVFAGDGARRRQIQAFLAKEPSARVCLLGYAPAEGLRAHLAAGDVHLVSQQPRWAGCMAPNKLQGAFNIGRPVLFVGGGDCAPAQWLRESGGGWAVAPHDVDGVVAAVRAALDHAERARRGAAAVAFAARHFDRATNVGRVCDALETAWRAPFPGAPAQEGIRPETV